MFGGLNSRLYEDSRLSEDSLKQFKKILLLEKEPRIILRELGQFPFKNLDQIDYFKKKNQYILFANRKIVE